ncbi:MAG: hypothetical protein ACT4PO_00660 [Actinomycetota bacterium]
MTPGSPTGSGLASAAGKPLGSRTKNPDVAASKLWHWSVSYTRAGPSMYAVSVYVPSSAGGATGSATAGTAAACTTRLEMSPTEDQRPVEALMPHRSCPPLGKALAFGAVTGV